MRTTPRVILILKQASFKVRLRWILAQKMAVTPIGQIHQKTSFRIVNKFSGFSNSNPSKVSHKPIHSMSRSMVHIFVNFFCEKFVLHGEPGKQKLPESANIDCFWKFSILPSAKLLIVFHWRKLLPRVVCKLKTHTVFSTSLEIWLIVWSCLNCTWHYIFRLSKSHFSHLWEFWKYYLLKFR